MRLIHPSIDDTDLQITHLEVNDGTVEGLRHSKYPAFPFSSTGTPPEADAEQLFDKFMALIDSNKEVLTYMLNELIFIKFSSSGLVLLLAKLNLIIPAHRACLALR